MELSLRGRDALEAVGALYQSAMSECDASAVLGTLAGLLHCEHAVLATRDGRGWQWESSGAMTGSARCSMDQICQEFFSSIERGQRADGLVRTSDVMDLRALARSDLYQEHLKPLNGGLSLMVHGRVEGDHIALALCRPLLESADFSTSDVQVTGAMWPHIKRAHLLRRALASESAKSTQGFLALDGVAAALIALDARGQVLHVNRSAQTLLLECPDLQVTRGRLVATRSADDAQVRALLNAALQGSAPAERLAMRLGSAQAQPGAAQLLLEVQPIYRGFDARAVDALCPEGAALWVSLKDVRRVHPSAQALRSVFGLTQRESEVAQRLCMGQVLGEIAADLHIAQDSVRQHLKSVFSKTQTRNQPQLVSLIWRSLS